MTDTTAVFVLSPKRTKSLDRATQVISYLRDHTEDPVSVRDICDACSAFYEEVLHVLTTLEALDLVERFSREGSPKEGPRVAYQWRTPTKEELAEMRDQFKGKKSPNSHLKNAS